MPAHETRKRILEDSKSEPMKEDFRIKFDKSTENPSRY